MQNVKIDPIQSSGATSIVRVNIDEWVNFLMEIVDYSYIYYPIVP